MRGFAGSLGLTRLLIFGILALAALKIPAAQAESQDENWISDTQEEDENPIIEKRKSKEADSFVAKQSLAESYPSPTFVVSVNGHEIPNRYIREFVLRLQGGSGRGPSSIAAEFPAQIRKAVALSVIPRQSFPKEFKDCQELILVLNDLESQSGAEVPQVKFEETKRTLGKIRRIEGEGSLEHVKVPGSKKQVCQLAQASSLILKEKSAP